MMDVSFIPFLALGLGLLCLWIFEGTAPWLTFFAVAVLTALPTHLMTPLGLGILLFAGASVYAYHGLPVSKTPKLILGIAMSLFVLGLFGHLFPGFKDKIVLAETALSPGAYSTSIIWSLDKPLIGLCLMGWGVKRIHRLADWKHVLGVSFILFAGCAALMLSVALPLHALGWAPKFTSTTGLFAVGNLLFVCVPEEAFFQGFVQHQLSRAFVTWKYGGLISVGLAALIFGVCHFAGGIGLMLVGTVAGLFYGTAYYRTGRLEAAILVHFLLNFTHFALFSYPALRQP